VSTPTAPKGTVDYYPPDGETLLAVRDGLLAPSRLAGYGYVETPIFEATELFSRGVGESTDVVNKEMYTFTDKGDRSVTLRPEGTAGVVRAVLEHGLERGALPVKLWYSGQMFRYERPQAGRQRQFLQVGIEALGSADPALDAEVVSLAAQGFRDLGLTQTRLLYNSLGDPACRPAYRIKLQEFLAGLPLDEDTRRRAEINPLRVLDDKRPEVAALVAGAPLIGEHLCDACREHDDEVRRLLAVLGVELVDAPRLVRGLDYYQRTTFEFDHPLLGAQSAVGGGGRYDGLSESIGGPPLPGVGWALGLERTLIALAAEKVAVATPPRVEVYVGAVEPAAQPVLVEVLAALRAAGVASDYDYGRQGRAVGKFLAAAGKTGAKVAVFAGPSEHEAGQVMVRDLQAREQRLVEPANVIQTVKEMLQ
jgi:histidyl-tRNA synthetase